jgi:hypothetical protein
MQLAATIFSLDYRKDVETKAEFQQAPIKLRKAFAKSALPATKVTVASLGYGNTQRWGVKVYALTRRSVSQVQALLDTFKY